VRGVPNALKDNRYVGIIFVMIFRIDFNTKMLSNYYLLPFLYIIYKYFNQDQKGEGGCLMH